VIETLNEIYITEKEYTTLKNNGIITNEKLYGKTIKIQKLYNEKIFFENKDSFYNNKESFLNDDIKNKFKKINMRF